MSDFFFCSFIFLTIKFAFGGCVMLVQIFYQPVPNFWIPYTFKKKNCMISLIVCYLFYGFLIFSTFKSWSFHKAILLVILYECISKFFKSIF